MNDILWIHYDPTQWAKPLEFIPERFDPESEYFLKPNTKEAREPEAYIPFSFGLRNCPGQALAKLTAKIVVSRLLTKAEFTVDEGQLNNDYARFGIHSQMKLKAKMTKKLIS